MSSKKSKSWAIVGEISRPACLMRWVTVQSRIIFRWQSFSHQLPMKCVVLLLPQEAPRPITGPICLATVNRPVYHFVTTWTRWPHRHQIPAHYHDYSCVRHGVRTSGLLCTGYVWARYACLQMFDCVLQACMADVDNGHISQPCQHSALRQVPVSTCCRDFWLFVRSYVRCTASVQPLFYSDILQCHVRNLQKFAFINFRNGFSFSEAA